MERGLGREVKFIPYLRRMQFSAVVGHEAIKKKLISNASEGRVAHTRLFAGPEGCGALPLALAYVQYLACAAPTPNDSCGKCSACIKMAKLIHPDLHLSFPMIKENTKSKGVSNELITEFRDCLLVNPYMGVDNWLDYINAGNKQPKIYVEEASEIIRQLSMVSVEDGYKFFIIWLPEFMNVETANRLLKSLEEPSDKTLIILVSEKPQDLLSTILSRAQLQKIEAYSIEECAAVIHSLVESTNEAARKVSEIAEGNVSLAKWLLENQDESDEQLDLFRNWMLACYQYNITELINQADSFQKKGREWQKGFLTYGLFMIRQTVLKNHQPSLNRLTDQENGFLDKFARFFHPGNYAEISTYVNDAILHIERNGHGKIIFFDCCILISDVFRKEKFAKTNA